MASSSPISSTSAQLTAIERLDWDFYSFFRVDYPEKNKTQIGMVRKLYGRREYVCLHFPTRWSNGYTSNAITHAQNRHRQLIQEALTAALNTTISDESVDMVDHFAATLAETISQQEEPVLQGKRPKSRAMASKKTGLDEDYTGWQGIPALQKLHNLAVWLRSSLLHSDSWRDAVGLSLGIDNATRWSSWYRVIDNAIRKKVQMNQFLLEHGREFENTVLSGSDWDLLAKTHAFLEPFASATLYAEGKSSSVSQSLFLMDSLLFHYESAKAQYSHPGSMDTRMLHAIEMGWFVLDKYYTMTEDVPVYAAALLLDPSKRLAYIQKNWPRDWHETAIAGAQDIWMTEY
ncbi:hypothetical protein NW769_015272 [Fusarium oxysporum]|nr:hypothetical protein NW769_015272 [Fusarium oxysporum]